MPFRFVPTRGCIILNVALLPYQDEPHQHSPLLIPIRINDQCETASRRARLHETSYSPSPARLAQASIGQAPPQAYSHDASLHCPQLSSPSGHAPATAPVVPMRALPGRAETGTGVMLHLAGTHQGCESRARHGRGGTQGSKPLNEEKMGKMSLHVGANHCHATEQRQNVSLLLFYPSPPSMKLQPRLFGTDHHVPLRRPAHRLGGAAAPGRVSPNRVHEEEARPRPGASGAISPRCVCVSFCRTTLGQGREDLLTSFSRAKR